MSRKSGHRHFAGLLIAVAGILLIEGAHPTASTNARSLTQSNSPTLPHPAHMHRGSCASGGELLVQLADVDLTTALADGTPVSEAIAELTTAIPVSQSTTTVPFALADLLADPVSIEVHDSALEPADVIACGDLGGTSTGPDLLIGLAPVQPHGVPGIALLRADGEVTVITIFLIEGIASMPPAPTTEANAETVTITLGGPTGEFTISASQTTFRVGVLYHFVVTNSGVIPHEFIILPTGLLGGESPDTEQVHIVALAQIDEEDLPMGATNTIDVIFTEPAPAGTLEFACALAGHYEGGMRLPIEVVP